MNHAGDMSVHDRESSTAQTAVQEKSSQEGRVRIEVLDGKAPRRGQRVVIQGIRFLVKHCKRTAPGIYDACLLRLTNPTK